MGHNRGGRWLDASATSREGLVLHESACLQRLIGELPDPAQQCPQLWVFLGSVAKSRCMHGIFAQNTFTRSPVGTIRLQPDAATYKEEFPVFWADVDLWNIPKVADINPGRGYRKYPLDWSEATADEAIHRVLCQVLFPFANVVCLFADDFPAGSGVASVVAKYSAAAKLPLRTRPRLVIVVGESGATGSWSSTVNSTQVSDVFSAVSLCMSTNTDHGHDRLKRLLMAHSQEVQSLRHAYTGRLSGTQLTVLLRSALAHLAGTRNQIFDSIRASRKSDEIPPFIVQNVNEYHQLCLRIGLQEPESTRFIASALLMDHYRPDMPLMDPELVFQTFYRSRLLDHPSSLAVALTNSIQTEFIAGFIQMCEQKVPSYELHRRRMSQGQYSMVQSNRLCLYCLVGIAQHFTPCDHALCDLCAQRFGSPIVDTEYHFSLDQCLLCSEMIYMQIETLPPTMDPSILAIDGGGVRGVIPLEFLILIQEYLGKCRVQELFDLDIATSSGGLIDLGLRALDLPVPLCAKIFSQLARRIFHNRRPAAFPWLPQSILGRVRQWYSWWKHDSCYDGTIFDTILRQLYGDRPLLHGHRTENNIKSGAKYGVVATSIGEKTETVILGNFNVAGSPNRDCGYRVIRPSNLDEEIPMWQAARATAAAPFIFAPIDTPVGTFQDGGLTENFAGGIARRVSRAIWPLCREPARLLSLGTGSPPDSTGESLPHFRHSILDGFLRRAFSAWMTSLEGEIKWREMQSQLDESVVTNFHRLNVPLEEGSSALDDIAMMDHYRNLVVRYPRSARMAKDVAINLLTARFFFELDTAPVFDITPFWCHGTIRCKGPAATILATLQNLVPGPLEFATDVHRLGPIVPSRDICPTCNRFCWPVSLLCNSAQQTLQIFIKATRYGRWRINSFPSTPHRLVHRQQLDLPFGGAGQGCPVRNPCPACDPGRMPFRGRRRRRQSLSSCSQKRKRVCVR